MTLNHTYCAQRGRLYYASITVFLVIVVESSAQIAVRIFTVFEHALMILLALLLFFTLLEETRELLGALLGGRDVLFVLPERLAAEAACKGLDRCHGEARTNLDEHKLVDIIFTRELLLVLVENLIMPEVDGIVDPVERDHMINERFALRMIFRRVEHVRQHFFGQLKLGSLVVIECRVK